MPLSKMGEDRMHTLVLLDAGRMCPLDLPQRLGLSSRQ